MCVTSAWRVSRVIQEKLIENAFAFEEGAKNGDVSCLDDQSVGSSFIFVDGYRPSWISVLGVF